MSNDIIIPDNIGAPSQLFRDRGVQTERLGEGIEGIGFPVIGVNGKEFYLRYKSRHYTIINPPANPPTDYDGMPAGYFDFIILRKAARRSHTYYKDVYKKGTNERPDCVSTDGIAPDDSVPPLDPVTGKGRQSDLCSLCERNRWKTLPSGREGRECVDSLRLAILPGARQMEALLGEPITEPCLFRIPAASLTALSALDDLVHKRFGADSPYCSYIIRATFKPKVEWPQFEYRIIAFLKDAQAEAIMEKREDPQAYRILGLTPDGNSLVRRPALPVDRHTPLQRISDKPQHTRAEVSPEIPYEPPPEDMGMVDQLAAERAARIAAVRQKPVLIDTKVVESTAAPKTPVQTRLHKEDQTYEVPETDDDIDALVAALKKPLPPGV